MTLIGYFGDYSNSLLRKLKLRRYRGGKNFPPPSWGPWISLKIKLTSTGERHVRLFNKSFM